MVSQFLPAVVGALLGLALGGSLAGLGRSIMWWPVGLASIAVQLLLARIPVAEHPWLGDNGHWVWAAAVAAVLPVLLRNGQLQSGVRRLPWFVAALGVSFNVLVIFANGGFMPVSQAALDATGQTAELAARTTFRRDIPIVDSTRLPWLADILEDPSWLPHPLVGSVGDRLLGLGLAGWAFLAVSASRRGYAARSAPTLVTGRLSANHRSNTSAATGLLAK
jgi:Family of unknown function (DUF5317)